MTFRTICDRTVTIRPRATSGTRDGYGNKAKDFGPDVTDVLARRDMRSATEDLADRDQQTWEFLYLIALRAADGTDVVLDGRSRIVDGVDVFEVVGTPELVTARRRPHHWEAKVQKVAG